MNILNYPRPSLSPAILTALLVWLVSPPTGFAKEAVQAYRGQITLPTYPWAAVKHPYFRGTDGKNIYPYPMLDFLSRDKTNRTYQTVILENEFLRLTFLPELGGRVHEVIDKATGQPMFYVNHVIKPGLIGQCGAWISGGIEWNTGPQGHTVSCVQPIEVEILPREKDGSRSVAIGETERIYRTKWTVVVTLRPGRSFIEERIRIYNPTETIRPYYFWNCTAVPNTKGFRFIYPMTLGTDHGAEKFFHWPINEGKDLSRGTNYQDASSIFAWYCDQDFFGSYNDDLDHGVVAYANHHQLPGKKAWTWGHGSYGTMHQADLTDHDGPYNEVQTGPLLTQGEVGRLDPCEAVEWKEWWYPIHGIGGFTFANKDVAVNATTDGGKLRLKIMGTGTWKGVQAKVGQDGRPLAAARCDITPRKPLEVTLDLGGTTGPFDIELSPRDSTRKGSAAVPAAPVGVLADRNQARSTSSGATLARFRLPLDLPVRQPPEKKRDAPQTATELAETGWQDFLFARFPEAETHFGQALEKDSKCALAQVGLAFLHLDSDPKAAAQSARAALAVEPGSGLSHYARAIAEQRAGHEAEALSEAWESALDPATAVAGRALVAKLLFPSCWYEEVVSTLTQPGPWQTDPLCRNRLAFALLKLGERNSAIRLAKENLEVDPLDAFARSILWSAKVEAGGHTLKRSLKGNTPTLLEVIEEYEQLNHWEQADWLVAECWRRGDGPEDAVVDYWLERGRGSYHRPAASRSAVFPYLPETIPVFRGALQIDPTDGHAALYLGHLLFHLGRYAEGREMWKKAAELGAEPVIAYRALGMAAKTLDGDLKTAREWLEKAGQADPKDAIVARDLAGVLFTLADKAGSEAEKREVTIEARDRLQAAFEQGKGRSDFVALLARAQTRLGEYAETAKMLDSVRVTIWEGAHEAHDLFEEAHLALGKAHLEAGRAAEALAEFNRALEYPANLATGRTETTRDAHIHYLRGNALAALGRKSDAIAAWKQAADEPASGDAKRDAARQDARRALEKAGVATK